MTTARSAMEQVAPHLAELSTDVLFGDVWERPGLSKRDRSLITVAALTALYRTDQLRGHIQRALDNGVTKEEIGEIITPHGLLRRVAHCGQRLSGRQGSLRQGLSRQAEIKRHAQAVLGSGIGNNDNCRGYVVSLTGRMVLCGDNLSAYMTTNGAHMTTYSIREFKARVSEILRDLDSGDEVIITRRGKP